LRGDYVGDDIQAVTHKAKTERQPVQWPIRPKAEYNHENKPCPPSENNGKDADLHTGISRKEDVITTCDGHAARKTPFVAAPVADRRPAGHDHLIAP
jgi:hypothetical protein